jgi:hypothetical protein
MLGERLCVSAEIGAHRGHPSSDHGRAAGSNVKKSHYGHANPLAAQPAVPDLPNREQRDTDSGSPLATPDDERGEHVHAALSAGAAVPDRSMKFLERVKGIEPSS